MSESSVADLNARMEDPSGEHAAAMAQFRPNFVVSSSPPFAEDDWDEISIGDEAQFTYLNPCSRSVDENYSCVVILANNHSDVVTLDASYCCVVTLDTKLLLCHYFS